MIYKETHPILKDFLRQKYNHEINGHKLEKNDMQRRTVGTVSGDW